MLFENGGYWWWDGILPPELCDSIIAEGDKLISGDGRIGGTPVGNNGVVDPSTRNTNISFFAEGHWVEGLCVHYAMLANRSSKWNFVLDGPQNVQYARYFPGQHYKPHKDDTIQPNVSQTMRKLSVSIQLSDPDSYSGGDFVIEDNTPGIFNKLLKFRKRGSVIVFPSLVTHGVEPVIQGVRHSVVCWVTGPNFR